MAAHIGLELTNLGQCPSSSCLLIDIHQGPRILVDTPLEIAGFRCFPIPRAAGTSAPNGGMGPAFVHTAQLGTVDPATVDCILLTNFHNITGLPYVTESSLGFKGRVLATEPTAHFGKLLMQELVDFVSTSSFSSHASNENSQFVSDVKGPASLALGPGRQLYTVKDLDRAMERVQGLNYAQSLKISGGVICTPYSSGFCLGGSNWLISNDTMRLAVIGATSPPSPILGMHPLPAKFDALQHLDIAIFTDLLPRDREPRTEGNVPVVRSLGDNLMLICKGTHQALSNRGNVLFPIQPAGTVLDIIDNLGRYLPQCQSTPHVNMAGVNMFLISPVGQNVLGYCEILAEWVNLTRRQRVYAPESPFIHNDLISSGRLHIVSEVHALSKEYKEPCIVFAGHPSLRFGPCLHFLRRWSSNKDNVLILTDSHIPRQSFPMNYLIAPLDPRLTGAQAREQIQQLSPQLSVTPHEWIPAGDNASITCYGGCMTSVSVQTPISSIPVTMDIDLACNLHVKKVGDVPATRVACDVLERDGTRELVPVQDAEAALHHANQRVVFGTVTAPALISALMRKGVMDCEVITGDRNQSILCTVKAPSLSAEVHLEAERCLVVTGMGSELAPDPEAVSKARILHEVLLDQLIEI